MPDEQRGLFIALEGIDCSGTSTQAQLLVASLRDQGRLVSLTSEPSQGPIGQLIRSYFIGRLQTSFSRPTQDKFFGCLFAADRMDHIFNPVDGVNKQLALGADVISTRYKFSSLAYNAEDESERAFVLNANSELPEPDLLVYLDCPLSVSLSRMRERVTRETYEKDEAKLARALENFRREVGLFNGAKLVLNASFPALDLASTIFSTVCSIRKKIEERAANHDR